MVRLATIALVLLITLGAASAEEPAATTVEGIARLLASPDTDAREEGARRLADELAATDDAAGLLRAVAGRVDALRAASAAAEAAAPTPPAGATTEPAPATAPTIEGPEPPPGPPPGPWRVTGAAVEVPISELDEGEVGGARTAAVETIRRALTAPGPVLVAGAPMRATLTAVPDARALELEDGGGAEGSFRLVHGRARRYRRDVAREEPGAWAVVTASLPPPLEIRVRVTPGADGLGLHVEVRHTVPPTRLPTEDVTPAEGVPPIEIDRAEWETRRVETDGALPADGGTVTIVAAGLLEGRLLVVDLRVDPLEPADEAR